MNAEQKAKVLDALKEGLEDENYDLDEACDDLTNHDAVAVPLFERPLTVRDFADRVIAEIEDEIFDARHASAVHKIIDIIRAEAGKAAEQVAWIDLVIRDIAEADEQEVKESEAMTVDAAMLRKYIEARAYQSQSAAPGKEGQS